MKSVIIGGVSRAGKSILSRRVSASLKLHPMPVDAIVVSLIGGFPQLGINWENDVASLAKMAPFLRVLICKLAFRFGFSYVFEGNHLTADLIYNLGPEFPILEGCVPVFLGSKAIDRAAKMRDLREHAKMNPCYTKHMSDEELSQLVANLAAESERLENHCKELGFPYFDTSEDFQAGIDAAYDYIISKV